MKIYTRTGDKGQTSLFGGERVSKNHGRVNAYGVLDELNSQLGLLIAECRRLLDFDCRKEIEWSLRVQRDLFALGSWLASKEASERVERGEDAFPGARKDRTTLNDARILELEKDIDGWEALLPPMTSFLLPGGHMLGAQTHVARTLCRRAEREVIALKESGEVVPELAIRYLNRLADALFVLSRHWNRRFAVPEDPWL